MYGVRYEHNLPASLPAGTRRVGWLTLTNEGTRAWSPTATGPGQGPVEVAVYLDDRLHAALPLPRTVLPGDRVSLHWYDRAPAQSGRHEYRFELVEHHVTWFAEQGVPPLRVPCDVTAERPTASARLLERSEAATALNWWTGVGVSWSRDGGSYPVMARHASGCRLTDVEGREYLDYVMGHGCALLGYAPERIQAAVARALSSAAVLSLMHELEVEVAEQIAAAVPGAERVLFGKNGSDACTAAVRLARAHTGRRLVLFCGYHGWQDWNVEPNGFASTGVPERDEPLALRFPFNDLESVARLFELHRGRIAAVILEPAGPIEGYNGPLDDADPAFLRELAALTRREGALLVFDEIVTGFRYREGSVQRATGVIPDLTCLGKGLSAGMPLAAMAGRADLFAASIGKIAYGPTFKGEVYSFAAAREALAIYREIDVPAHVWSYGRRLQQAIDRICADLDAPARMIGPPFRMLLAFDEPDPERLRLTRTLMQQELLRNGLLCNMTFFIPSHAHDDRALARTCEAFGRALETVMEARRLDCVASRLEIAPVHV